jgi:ABC-type Fe3+/spermidine/putrescine transport system ATPase subunit
MRPAIILLDEPLSNLDARLRSDIREELAELHRRLGTTMVYVTHDQEDALALSSRIALIDRGRIQQVGSPIDIYSFPQSPFTAKFIGDANLLPCSLIANSSGDTHSVRLTTAAAPEFQIVHTGQRSGAAGDGFLCVRPEEVVVSEATGAPDTYLRAVVSRVTYHGARYTLELRIDESLSVRASVRGHEVPGPLHEGQQVAVSWTEGSAVFIPAE